MARLGICALLFPALTGAARAENGFSCLFTVECEAAGACAPADILTEIARTEDGPTVFLDAASEDYPAMQLSEDGEVPYVLATYIPGAEADLITINLDGTAYRTVHPAEPSLPARTYFGTCQEM